MIEKIIAIYVFIDDVLIESGHKEHVNRNTSDSELITVALIAAKYFHGNIDHAISFVKSTQLISGMLSKSRFNRRIHSIFELSMFPKRIHAVTPNGFLMKIVLFIFVFTINEKFL